MLANLLSSINTNVTEFLDRLIFINSDVTLNLINVLGKNSYSGINLICNSLIYGFLLYYAFSYLLSHLTFAQIESPHQFIFKLILCVFALNASLVLCSGLIFIFSYVSNMIRELGNYLLGVDVSFTGLISNVIPKDYFISNSFSLFNFDGILKASISFGFLSLTISYSIRYILIKTLVILAPFAILSLCSSKTNWFFKSWFKSLLSMLFLQIFVAIILLVCFIVENNGVASLPSQIIHLGMIYTLFKANSFVKEFIGGFGTDVSLNASSLSSFFRGGDLK
jgi:hypothetical protein